jgi:hypothetical protein
MAKWKEADNVGFGDWRKDRERLGGLEGSMLKQIMGIKLRLEARVHDIWKVNRGGLRIWNRGVQ